MRVTDEALGHADIARARDAAVATGKWKPAAELMRDIGRDWDKRAVAACALGKVAQDHPGWFFGWQHAEPASPDFLAVRAQSLVMAAWAARGAARADQANQAAFQAFHHLLRQADEACREAVSGDGDDPTPWMTWITVARGLARPRQDFDWLWKQLSDRAPHHRHGHDQALQYLCEKWHGSHDEMFAFAAHTASNAPKRSPLVLILLHAHIEYARQEHRKNPGFAPADYWGRPEVRTDLQAIQELWPVSSAERGPTFLADAALLAYAQAQSGGWLDMAATFNAVDSRLYRFPWSYSPERYMHDVHASAVAKLREARR
ncbi:hypothetical protein LO772_16985 [Yinghuangia sp. ASG 101]|uniref:hypothetical protein n=1 Tax=Yinghuangia sp. ASG 101 TaxID=2896848 RepID=UPI001E6058F4|nr:hypothetical protein [Yinghuangia sp. ASG 101]UGQ15108.1 hypothetical protein LO772_16985 [Yinghuangia sp. ASG 101]